MNRILGVLSLLFLLNACATTIAVIDITTSTAIYAGKTVVNTIDAITPDIVNGDD